MVRGVINLQGSIVPVLNLRKRLGLPEREIDSSNQFIVAKTGSRRVVLVVDRVVGVIDRAEEQIAPIVAASPWISGAAKLDDGLLFVHNLELFLSLDDEQRLDLALKKAS
jgi:purine-binding chemotaxis protein CheW